ncbi:hypothetical protein ABZ642_06485 [Streptomyces sp. NPDC007157]|uniref:hypothetical protein n=1 Tax=Streptomyces sp. NPDC007157 TaxID=3154681 RepID=UPI00340ACE88
MSPVNSFGNYFETFAQPVQPFPHFKRMPGEFTITSVDNRPIEDQIMDPRILECFDIQGECCQQILNMPLSGAITGAAGDRPPGWASCRDSYARSPG